MLDWAARCVFGFGFALSLIAVAAVILKGHELAVQKPKCVIGPPSWFYCYAAEATDARP
ncbi:hypothetical protein GL4_2880 [Methyloceanibacter caenitepidi]|uniref:Uncharacterized protein n=1 Tax=Methyloceanibacter caenitepidi TaxID=1384459 RepID=A0A0A8K5U0_9HYPH|nr:hypothetical protein GL4_2880 [Methyloceanibacter caenitepidi]